jgi:2'-5' RNA ligase
MEVPDETWRLFIAIELPPNVRSALKAHIDQLRTAVPEARAGWAAEANLHLTLKFLGDTPLTRVEGLSRAARRAAHSVDSFEMIIGNCGAFPSSGQPRVLWIGVEDPSNRLTLLHQALEDECDQAGFAREERSFRPHLTIARLRKPQGARGLAQTHKKMGFDQKAVVVSHLALIRSELRKEGSRHTVIARHPFSLRLRN